MSGDCTSDTQGSHCVCYSVKEDLLERNKLIEQVQLHHASLNTSVPTSCFE